MTLTEACAVLIADQSGLRFDDGDKTWFSVVRRAREVVRAAAEYEHVKQRARET